MTEITKKEFDYKLVGDLQVRAMMKTEAAAIKASAKRASESVVDIGNRLIKVKASVGHGHFTSWCEGEFELSYQMAYSFMNTAKAFSKLNFNLDLKISQTAIFMLSAPSVSDETREEAIEAIQKGELKTVAETKRLIEKAKPVKPTPKPVETSTPAAETPPDDADDSDPYEDVGAAKTDGYGRPIPKEPEEVFEEMDEIDESLNRAEIVYDNSADFKKEADMTDEEWLESLPIYRVLKTKQHKAIFIKEDLLSIRKLWPQIEKFQYHAVRAFDQKALRNTPAAQSVRSVQTLPHPADWQICGPCRGNGCTKCDNAGYHIHGAGISPLRVEKGEVEL